MEDRAKHDTIRALYKGVVEPQAWQRGLHALCLLSDSAQASLLFVDTGLGTVHVRASANRTVEGAPEPPWPRRHLGLPRASSLPIGGWHIERRKLAPVAADSRDLHDEPSSGESAQPPALTYLVDRKPSYDVYLTLQRMPGEAAYSEHDAYALDWVIPHLREAISLSDRTFVTATHERVSTDLFNRLPFGVIVFAESGKVLLANDAGAPWVQRLLPAMTVSDLAASAGGAAASTSPDLGGWQLSRPFTDVLRALSNPDAHLPIQAVRAVGADGRSTQIVAVGLTPTNSLPSTWPGRPILASIHESHDGPRAAPAVLRDLYGLTPAENRLAMLLTQGMGLPDACAHLGIKRETSRSQLKSIFTKTNTGTQAQLSHLLTRLGSVMAEPARWQHN